MFENKPDFEKNIFYFLAHVFFSSLNSVQFIPKYLLRIFYYICFVTINGVILLHEQFILS